MNSKRFSTFEGVFTPTFLSILGVIMYLRLGWVVGNVGLLKALAIIIVCNIITICTGLSMSSIVTNIKVGAGGAYSMIAKSLGLQVGGAIGIPLYISQSLSVAFYITGFTECWRSVFPNHNFLMVCVLVWAILLTVSYISAKLAFRLQYGIMALIVLSLVSIFIAKVSSAPVAIQWQGTGQIGFWAVFAVFFPAVTGVLAGASMSGELKDASRSIPIGTLLAIGVSFFIYVALTFWFAANANASELTSNTSIIIEMARWRWAVIAGIMGATISSALSMFITGPRTLQALAKHRMIPVSELLSKQSLRGEPTNAILLTAVISLLTLFMGTLNNIATLLTMFFLITYATINLSVFIEQSMGIVSFRPSLKLNLIFPFIGSVGCIWVMFLINPLFSIVAIIIIIGIYIALLRREVREYWPDVRKGLFVFIAEHAMKIAHNLPYHPKIWKPNLLIPVDEPREWTPLAPFIRAVTFPSGRMMFYKTVNPRECRIEEGETEEYFDIKSRYKEDIQRLVEPLRDSGLLVCLKVVDCIDVSMSINVGLQALKGSVFPPNVVFLKLGAENSKDIIVKSVFEKSRIEGMGVIVLSLHPKLMFAHEKVVNLWVRERSPNVDMAILIALQLVKNWGGSLRLIQVVDNEEDKERGDEYLEKLRKLMRIPKNTESCVLVGSFALIIKNAPVADVNIFGMAEDINVNWMRDTANDIGTSVLFLADSPHESAIA